MTVREATYNWNGTLTGRHVTEYIVLHHRAGSGDAESIHQAHLKRGWVGIGYHFYVRKDGSVYRGRPINTIGAHCINYNSVSIGVCFEGDFENEEMPVKQLKAGQELVSYLESLYPEVIVRRHSDLCVTACPGKNFPFEEIEKGVVGTAKELTTANDIIWELMNGVLKVDIAEVQKAVKALDKAKKENSSLYWILRKIVNKRG